MAFLDRNTEKLVTQVGMGVAGYSILAPVLRLPLPEIITKPLIGPVSIVVIAAGLTLYGVYQLTKY